MTGNALGHGREARRSVAADLAADGAIKSGALLQGRPCVTIDHNGTPYVLSATRAGKLILTK